MVLKLFVGKIPFTATEDDLRKVFEQFGLLKEVAVMRKPDGTSKGSAWVIYEDDAAGHRAIEVLHEKISMSHGQPIVVKVANKPGAAPSPIPEPSVIISSAPAPAAMASASGKGGRKVFVGQLPRTMLEDQVREMFKDFGTIEETVIIREKGTGMSKGAGFVIFSTPEEAERAVSSMHEAVMLEGCTQAIQVRIAESERPRPAPAPAGMATDSSGYIKLFVGQVPYSATEDDIRGIFSPYGEIAEVVLIRNPENPTQHKGAGFVKFTNPDSARNAIQGLHQAEWGDRRLLVKIADAPSAKTAASPQPVMMPGMPMQPQYTGYGFGQPVMPPQPAMQAYNQQQIMSLVSQVQTLQSQQSDPNMANMLGSVHASLVGMARTVPPHEISQIPAVQGVQYGTASAAPPRGQKRQGPAGANLMVRGIPNTSDEADLERLFRPYGEILSTTIFRDKETNQSKGFGFVSFVNVPDAQAAISGLDGTMMGGRRLQVEVKSSDRFTMY